MIVGPRYNDSDPAVERAAMAHADELDECDNCDATTDIDAASGLCPTCLWTTEETRP